MRFLIPLSSVNLTHYTLYLYKETLHVWHHYKGLFNTELLSMYVIAKPDLCDNFTPNYMIIFNCVALNVLIYFRQIYIMLNMSQEKFIFSPNLHFSSSFSIRFSKMMHKFSVYWILSVSTSKDNLIKIEFREKNMIFTILLYKVVDVADLNNNLYIPSYTCVMFKIHKRV